MQSDTPTADARGNRERYHILFVNNSPNIGSACLYQLYQKVNSDFDPVPGLMSLAWFAKVIAPATRDVFDWTMDYCFVWAGLGRLKPGNLFKPSQVLPADPSSTNKITFSSDGENFSFQNPAEQRPQGNLYINAGPFYPNQAAVGIGMSGNGTFAAPARPQWLYSFTPRGTYWIAFGDYKQGQVLDVTQINNPAEIVFPPGIYSMTVTLNRDNSWTIEPIFDGEDG